jgi:hypothetical protein
MQRIIVGTGRCGSTLLSGMLAYHPGVLSMSEFWSIIDRDAVFQDGLFDGADVAGFVARNNLLNDLVMSRNPFLDASTGHSIRKEVTPYALRAKGHPAIKVFLSKFTQDVDALYAATIDFFRACPRQSLADHWHMFFDWLCARTGRQVWIERSGVSLEFVGRLMDWYPDARFVHIHRDGPTNALAIRAFRHFVLYASFFLNPPDAAELHQALTCEIGGADDPILRRMTREVPSLQDFGHYWSWQIARGYRDLMRLPPTQRLDIRYEDLTSAPQPTLRKIADFFELPDGGDWTARAAGEIDTDAVTDRVAALTPDVRRALEQACLPGQALLGRAPDNPYEESLHRARREADRLTGQQENAP